VARTPAHATVFANGVGLGATFSHETIHAVGAVVGEEARGLHNGFLASDPDNRQMGCNGCSLTMYAPNLNLIRDPRWGRAQEVYGEDPHHMGELVTQFVTGAQNNSVGDSVGPEGYLQAGTCCKHFAAYDIESYLGGKGGGRNSFDAELTSRDMWETYMPAFKACITKGKSSHVMCSYNGAAPFRKRLFGALFILNTSTKPPRQARNQHRKS
jgi:beta-glucosidase